MNKKKGGLTGSVVSSKKFLDYLHNFIQTELLLSQGKCRIGIYRQAFDYFIQEFKTYSSVLSDIKNEYEITIDRLEESVRMLQPLKGKLEITRLQNLQELNAQTRDMDQFLEKFRIENQDLREESQLLNERLKAQKLEISKLSHENAFLKDKIKEFSSIITEKKPREVEANETSHKDIEIERLRGLLVKANRQIADLTTDLRGVMENNDDLITPDKFHQEKAKVDDLSKKYQGALGEITILSKKIDDLTQKNEEYAKESVLLESFKFPDWQYIQYQVPYRVREYELGCKRMSCNDVIGQLLTEILKVFSSFQKT